MLLKKKFLETFYDLLVHSAEQYKLGLGAVWSGSTLVANTWLVFTERRSFDEFCTFLVLFFSCFELLFGYPVLVFSQSFKKKHILEPLHNFKTMSFGRISFTGASFFEEP